jgi:hypothetical protein
VQSNAALGERSACATRTGASQHAIDGSDLLLVAVCLSLHKALEALSVQAVLACAAGEAHWRLVCILVANAAAAA